MTSIILKTCAIVLCLIFAFTIVLPQAHAEWNKQQCQIWEVACQIATAVAEAICAAEPDGDLCALATIVAAVICALVEANCP